MTDGTRPPDREAELKNIVEKYMEKESRERDRDKEMAVSRERSQKAAIYFRIAGLLAGAGLSICLAFTVLSATGALGGKEYWAAGKTGRLDAAGEACLGRMWRMRKAIDRYYADNKAYPDAATAVYKYFPSRRDAACPATGAEYVLTKKDGREVFACPNPEKHGVRGLWGAVKGGPPVIEKK